MRKKFFRTVDRRYGRIVDMHDLVVRDKTEQFLTSKRMAILKFMIDGRYNFLSNWTYGGNGTAWINFLGGFGYDAEVRRMVKSGEITIKRIQHHDNCHGGNPTINATVATVTEKGRKAYTRWKKRMDKRLK